MQHSRHLPLFVVLLALFAATLPVLRAHDPYEITAEFRSDAKYVELRVTFARQTAMKVARAEANGRIQFGPNQFEEVRPALEKCARRVFALRTGDNAATAATALEPIELGAALTPESDIEFRLLYARPAANTVRFEAGFLRDLEDPGYVAIVQWIHEHRVVTEHRIHRDAPSVALPVPPAQ